MGLRGPSSKAASLRLLEGTARVGVTTIEPEGVAVCPKWLDDYAKEVWHDVVASFPPRYFTKADEQLLAAYCVGCSQLRTSSIALSTAGYTGTTSHGNQTVSAWVRVSNQAKSSLAGLASKLGIGPAVRGDHAAPTNPRSKGARKARVMFGTSRMK